MKKYKLVVIIVTAFLLIITINHLGLIGATDNDTKWNLVDKTSEQITAKFASINRNNETLIRLETSSNDDSVVIVGIKSPDGSYQEVSTAEYIVSLTQDYEFEVYYTKTTIESLDENSNIIEKSDKVVFTYNFIQEDTNKATTYSNDPIVFEHTISNVTNEYARNINISAIINSGTIDKIILPDNSEISVNNMNWPDSNSYLYKVTDNATYKFIGVDMDGIQTAYEIPINDIGLPSLAADSIYVNISELNTITEDTLISLMNVKATTIELKDDFDGGTISLTNGDLANVKNLTAADEYVTVTVIATSYTGLTTTKTVTITATNNYFVTFNTNGGSPVPPNQALASGGHVSEPTIPKRTGFSFEGWYQDASFTNKWDFENNTINNTSISLYAKWKVDNPPVISGLTDITLKKGLTTNLIVGVEANDDEDGNITTSIQYPTTNIATLEVGEHYLEYKVTDSSDNVIVALRKITIIANNPPVISGLTDITLKKGLTTNIIVGVEANDIEDGNITSKIKYPTTNIATLEVGEHQLEYQVTDNDDNTTTAFRKVTILTDNPPVIVGINNITIKNSEVDQFNALDNVTVEDDHDIIATSEIKVSGKIEKITGGTTKTFKLIYKVVDSDRNTTEVTRLVTVTNLAPTFSGIDSVTIKEGLNFNLETGVKATDNEDGDITTNITYPKVDVPTLKVGTYNLEYTVVDSDGNKTTAIRVVIIEAINASLFNAPKIYANNLRIQIGSNFDPIQYIQVFDDEDGDITNKIKVIANNVNTAVVGIYSVIYEVTDNDGNTAIKEIIVSIENNNSTNNIFSANTNQNIVTGNKNGDISTNEQNSSNNAGNKPTTPSDNNNEDNQQETSKDNNTLLYGTIGLIAIIIIATTIIIRNYINKSKVGTDNDN